MNIFFAIFLQTQTGEGFLFGGNKLHTVLIVVLVILLGFVTFLVLQERKLNEIEKKIAELENDSEKKE